VAARKTLTSALSTSRTSLDFPGALTLIVGVGCFLGGLTEGRLGWGRPEVYLYLAAATLAAFSAGAGVLGLLALPPLS